MVQFLGSSEVGQWRRSASSLSSCLVCLQVVRREDGHEIQCKGTNLVVEADGTVRPKHEWSIYFLHFFSCK